MINVLFVCLGNICRSPMAEGLFIHQVEQAGLSNQLHIDSAGTGSWHVGERADPRMRQTAGKHGIELPSRARKVVEADFRRYDYILAMDASNLQDLQDLGEQVSGRKAQLLKMRHFDPEAPDADVPDPYYGGERGFEDVYAMLARSTQALLEFLVETHGLEAQKI
jgi:protein-tyrosine phosphatase